MVNILEDLTPANLIIAIEENFCEFLTDYVAHWSEITVHNEAHLLRTICPINFPIFNSVARSQLSSENLDATIEAVLAPYKAQGLALGWRLTPNSLPPTLGEALVAHGFRRGGELPGMAIELAKLPTEAPQIPNFTIELVEDDAALVSWNEVSGAAFEMPDSVNAALLECYRAGKGQTKMRHYLGRLDGEPVATSSLFIGTGVAGIYDVATLPDFRGRGFGKAITLAALQVARQEGYRAGILHSSEEGYNLYRHIGFQEYCKLVRYAWLPESHEI